MQTLKRVAWAAGLIGLAACYPPPPPGAVYVASRPPAYRVEVVSVAPGPEFVWIGGYWTWGGAEYGWVPGHWARRPYPRAAWVPGRWRGAHRGWYWSPGHWR